jgi:hypothetical protein
MVKIIIIFIINKHNFLKFFLLNIKLIFFVHLAKRSEKKTSNNKIIKIRLKN